MASTVAMTSKRTIRNVISSILLSRAGLIVLLVALLSSVTLKRTLRIAGRWRGPNANAAGANTYWAFWGLGWVSVAPANGGMFAQRRASFEAGRRPEGDAISDVDNDAGKLCVRMPRLSDLKIVMVALPKESYTVSGAISRAGLDDGQLTEVTGRGMNSVEEYVENLKALWSYTEGLTLRSGDVDLSSVRLRSIAWSAIRESILDGAKYVSNREPPAVLSTPLLKRALAATPVLFEHVQRSLDRYVYTSYKEPQLIEQVVIASFMASPYVTIVDGRNMTAADVAGADYVFVPFPLSNMRMRPSVLRKMTRIMSQYVPGLESFPGKHIFVWGRTVQDAVKTLEYFETMRSLIKRWPFRGANLLTFEPYRVSDGLTRQHAIPYTGIVRHDGLAYLPPSESAHLSRASPFDVLHGGNVDTASLGDAYASARAEGATELVAWAGSTSQADAAARAAGLEGAASKFEGLSSGGIASSAVAPPRYECDPLQRIMDWKEEATRRRGCGGAGGPVDGGPVNCTLLGVPKPQPPPVSSETGQKASFDRSALIQDARFGRYVPDGCTPQEAMAAVRSFRPILASFVGSAIGESGDRTLILRQLYRCPECAIFDHGHFSSNTQHNHFGVAWAGRMSTFCVQPTGKTPRKGESPSRKGFFDALLLGCIPVVVDRGDPAAGATAPMLPFSWAIPWREIAVMLPRGVMTGSLVEALRSIAPGEIRARQVKLAEAARLLQWDWSIMEFKLLVRKAFGRLHGSNSSAAVAARTAPLCARDAFDMTLATLYHRSGKTGSEPGVHVPRTDPAQLAFIEAV